MQYEQPGTGSQLIPVISNTNTLSSRANLRSGNNSSDIRARHNFETKEVTMGWKCSSNVETKCITEISMRNILESAHLED